MIGLPQIDEMADNVSFLCGGNDDMAWHGWRMAWTRYEGKRSNTPT
jgi:hypothetical protein